MADDRSPNANLPDIVIPDVADQPSPELPGRRIVLDRSSPSVRSIVRVVLITLLILAIAGSVVLVFTYVTPLLFLIILSIFVAYLLDPLVRVVRHPFESFNVPKLMPRPLAIVIAYFWVLIVLGGAISYVAPRLVEQAKEFGTNLPTFIQEIRKRSLEINHRFDRLRVPDEIQAELNKRVTDLGTNITEWVGNFVLLSVTYLPWFILVPILSFFFLKDANLFRLAVLRMFPAGPLRIRAESVLEDVNKTLAAYTRAQLISCMIIATICTIGFYFIGLKYALLLGILAGIFEFVPLLGPLTIGVIVTVTAAGSDNPWNALYAAIFLIVLRIEHDYFTYPRIVRGGIHLHPLAIILSVLAGEQVAGIPGVFIAIPIVAVGTVIYRHILEHHGRHGLISGWIETAPEPPAEEAA
jgi:predicted PurR-regulated permease PerM